MSFVEAYKEMLNGKKIKRPGFKGYWYINPENGIFTIKLANGKDIEYGKLDLTVKNCVANDWEIIEE